MEALMTTRRENAMGLIEGRGEVRLDEPELRLRAPRDTRSNRPTARRLPDGDLNRPKEISNLFSSKSAMAGLPGQCAGQIQGDTPINPNNCGDYHQTGNSTAFWRRVTKTDVQTRR